jgi:hypothetical protein
MRTIAVVARRATRHPDASRINLCAAALVAFSGCGGGGDVGTSTPATSTTPAASAGGQTYSSKASALPLTVTVDAGLKSPPSSDSPNLLSCFGPQPDLLLHLAVVDVGESTLLAWARMNTGNPDPAFAAMFEQMLITVRFR